MRLTKLKIAGFKSFVEPTTVLFPGQLAGVVGPNGCGKSNIIDAVRWVLGESKASELRGESIQDVIFKGSGNRREVSRASVELFFDNDQGRAAGQWSQYAEITVKRILDREGNSSYYINNLHVRRRDVIDLFLGTGLGPRAYAIIGQGMISRIVEAKPDELRFFLEEAAGVTKYKERRKETEHRLEDARENLARVDDIRSELGTQVNRLQGQADVAAQYRELQAAQARTQTVLWLKKRNDARADGERMARAVDEAVIRIERETALLREIEAQVEQAREAHFSASDVLHATQADMISANSEVTRLETEIRHVHESRLRLDARRQQLSGEQDRWRDQLAQLAQDETRWSALLDNARTRAELAAARHDEAAQALPEAEDAVQTLGTQLGEARRVLAESEQALRLAEADRAHAQRALDQLAQRHNRLTQDRQALGAPDPASLAAAIAAQESGEEALARAQEALEHWQGGLPQAEAQVRQTREALQAAHRALTQTRARHDALGALQAQVTQDGDMAQWLAAHALAEAKPLWQSLRVEVGWETALEAVLRERFAARLCAAPALHAALAARPPGALVLALAAPPEGLAGGATGRAIATSGSLRAKVVCDEPAWDRALDEWLADVVAVDDLAAQIPHVHEHGMAAHVPLYVAREGHLLSPAGLSFYVPDARTHGVIERQREIDALAAQLLDLEAAEDAARTAQHGAEQALTRHQGELSTARRALQEAQQQRHNAQVEALTLRQAQDRFDESAARINAELAEVARAQSAEELNTERAAEAGTLHAERLAQVRADVEQVLARQRQAEAALREARTLEQQIAREAQEAGFSERECLSKLEDNARAADTASTQLERIIGELANTTQEVAAINDEVLQAQLHSALDLRSARESALAERRNQLETAAAGLRHLDEQRLRLEQGLDPLREKVGELKLKSQAAQLSESQYCERLAEAHILADADELPYADELAKGQRDAALQSEIGRLEAAIEALGPVNLAALDELNAASERKTWLDAQSADLAEAIGTLEDAIMRIDRETRAQLQDTYDSVNRQFGTLFPQLFGGGEARLVLTGEEILDAGIQIMAQPPGKKNSTIHLLSGGEKALTAIALVFALFHLNPAPFCMLDEVDAPLDDSNTVRFCEMVKRMSATTQFIFISHNKIAMEMAQQLIGVTMQEQGVSRVVEVDMFEALRLAQSTEAA